MLVERLKIKMRTEAGNALITVIGIMTVLGIIGVTLFASSMSHIRVTAAHQTGVAAQAASDSGIDRAIAWLHGVESDGSYVAPRKYQDILDGRLPTPQGAAIEVGEFYVTLDYRYRVMKDNGSTAIQENFTENDIPLSLVVDSLAIPKSYNGSMKSATERRTTAEINFIHPDASFDKAIFSGSDDTLTITNNMELVESDRPGFGKDAHVYSNGPIECRTQTKVNGTIYSQGAVTIHNNCKSLNTVWAGGNITLQDGAYLLGDAYATGSIFMNHNAPGVAGSAIANGDIHLGTTSPVSVSNQDFRNQNYRNYCWDSSNKGSPFDPDFEDASNFTHRYNNGLRPAHVCKDVVSFKGSVFGYNGNSRVNGSIFAAGNVNFAGHYGNNESVISTNNQAILGDVRIVGDFNNTNSSTGQGALTKGRIMVGGRINPAWSNDVLNSYINALTSTGHPRNCESTPGGQFNACSVPITMSTLTGLDLIPTNQNGVFPEDLFSNNKSEILAPKSETMPVIKTPDESGEEYDPWYAWAKRNFGDNCNAAREFIASGGDIGVDSLVLVDDNACSGQMQFNGSEPPLRDTNRTITVRSNMAVMYNQGFSFTNNVKFEVASEVDSSNLDLFFIVPADKTSWKYNTSELPPGSECSNDWRNYGNITASQLSFPGANEKQFGLMFYTPCSVNISNNWSSNTGGENGVFRGQIYGGQVILPQNSHFKMNPVSVPSEPIKPQPTDTVSAVVVGRYNSSVLEQI